MGSKRLLQGSNKERLRIKTDGGGGGGRVTAAQTRRGSDRTSGPLSVHLWRRRSACPRGRDASDVMRAVG